MHTEFVRLVCSKLAIIQLLLAQQCHSSSLHLEIHTLGHEDCQPFKNAHPFKDAI